MKWQIIYPSVMGKIISYGNFDTEQEAKIIAKERLGHQCQYWLAPVENHKYANQDDFTPNWFYKD